MIRTLAVAALLAAALPAFAQEEEVFEQIETVQGDAEGFGELFGAIQDALMFEDMESFAALAEYPLTVNANGEVYDIIDAEDLVAYFDDLVLPETYEAIMGASYADLIVTSEGVGLAAGALWTANLCTDDSCEETYWAIISLNN